MTTLPYDEHASIRRESRAEASPRTDIAPIGPGLRFLFVAWFVAAAFWVASMVIDVGILEAAMKQAPVGGGVDAGGLGFLLMDVIGVLVLGVAIAYGLARYATRDRREDAVTEASTAALYDQIEREGGEDLTARSPDAQTPEQRDAYRAAQSGGGQPGGGQSTQG
ncbi:hypothetical protein DJ021_14615 [Phenylobacterium hankyongense]|uniref:Uncharacterized protein n=1 Tax=Phenylobacterium hankyongense TaxID=1813876 RepID=A0A328B507_9CAUL|nr:hypothetical protein [Phenylobacterium hankyongense]RAK60954.1 hypothetical protein DJ021_14615 [Phenylobacterium hankyongense]